MAGGKSEEADEGDERHRGSPPGKKQDGGFVNCFMVHVCNDRQRPDHPALGVGGYSLHESS